jgi:hypothetical protein
MVAIFACRGFMQASVASLMASVPSGLSVYCSLMARLCWLQSVIAARISVASAANAVSKHPQMLFACWTSARLQPNNVNAATPALNRILFGM